MLPLASLLDLCYKDTNISDFCISISFYLPNLKPCILIVAKLHSDAIFQMQSGIYLHWPQHLAEIIWSLDEHALFQQFLAIFLSSGTSSFCAAQMFSFNTTLTVKKNKMFCEILVNVLFNWTPSVKIQTLPGISGWNIAFLNICGLSIFPLEN